MYVSLWGDPRTVWLEKGEVAVIKEIYRPGNMQSVTLEDFFGRTHKWGDIEDVWEIVDESR